MVIVAWWALAGLSVSPPAILRGLCEVHPAGAGFDLSAFDQVRYEVSRWMWSLVVEVLCEVGGVFVDDSLDGDHAVAWYGRSWDLVQWFSSADKRVKRLIYAAL